MMSSEVIKEVGRLGLDRNVEFLGFQENISAFYKDFDILAFISHLDAPGRPIFEAAFFSVPSIVCIAKPQPDTVVPNVTLLWFPKSGLM